MHATQLHMTRDEYLALAHSSKDKYEFYQGQIFAMAGGSFNHAKIGLNVASYLVNVLRGSSCQTLNSDMRISTPSGLDTYPDVSVFCGDPELTDNHCTLLNPILIVEVLSPSTRSYDRGDKFMLYRSLTSLQDYLLVDSEAVLVEHYQRKQQYEWQLREYRDLMAPLYLQSITQTITLQAIYEGVVFSPA